MKSKEIKIKIYSPAGTELEFAEVVLRLGFRTGTFCQGVSELELISKIIEAEHKNC